MANNEDIKSSSPHAKNDPTIAPPSDYDIFLDTPPELTTIILSQYCDAKSLSTLLITFLSSKTYRYFVQDILLAIKAKVLLLQKKDLIAPVVHGRIHSRWRNLAFAEVLLSYNNDRINCNKTDLTTITTTWPEVIPHIGPISERLAALSFFEDRALQLPIKASSSRPSNGENKDEKEEKEEKEGVEWPLWCGTLSMDCGARHLGCGASIETARVVATTPSTTWHHVLVAEWAKFSKFKTTSSGSGNVENIMRPRPRRATPLPPLARMRGCTPRDNISLRKMAKRLRELDEVASMGEMPISYMRSRHDDHGASSSSSSSSSTVPMSVLIMSRRQAVKRLCSGRYMRRRPRSMWPLDYECVHDCNGCNHELHRIQKNDDESQAELDNINGNEESDEVFAFMDGPYIGFDEHEDDDLIDFSTVVTDLITVMNTHQSFVPSQTERATNDMAASFDKSKLE